MQFISEKILVISTHPLVKYLQLISLGHKFFTIFLVYFYYSEIEGVPSFERLSQNDETIFIFLFWQHIASCLPLKFDTQRESHKKSEIILFVMGFITLIWPILAWLDYPITHVDSDYWKVRYFYNFLYIFFTNIVRISAVDALQLLICDGVLLSQMICMLMYN